MILLALVVNASTVNVVNTDVAIMKIVCHIKNMLRLLCGTSLFFQMQLSQRYVNGIQSAAL